jgi:hypothetical protein
MAAPEQYVDGEGATQFGLARPPPSIAHRAGRQLPGDSYGNYIKN